MGGFFFGTLIADFIFLGEWIFELFTQSNTESNLETNSAVPIAADGRPPILTYVHRDAATVWLKIWEAYLTFILQTLLGFMCLSVNLGAALMVSSLSFSQKSLISTWQLIGQT